MIEQDQPNTTLLNSSDFDFTKCQGCFNSIVKFGTYSPVDLLHEYLREGTHELSCLNGHKTIVCLQDFEFSIHFHMGSLTLIDGHYTSSLFHFHSTLESFYRWFIELFILEYDLEERKKIWKSITNQSERQLGAFISLYLTRFRKSPLVFREQKFNNKKNCGEFRNDFDHKGYLASKEEAFKYGKMILTYIRALIAECQEGYNDKIKKLICIHLQNLAEKNKPIIPTVVALGGILSLVQDSNLKELPFGARLDRLQENKMHEQKKKRTSWGSLD